MFATEYGILEKKFTGECSPRQAQTRGSVLYRTDGPDCSPEKELEE